MHGVVINLHCQFAWVWSHLGDSLLPMSVNKFAEWLSATGRVSWIHFYCSDVFVFIKFYQDIYRFHCSPHPSHPQPTQLLLHVPTPASPSTSHPLHPQFTQEISSICPSQGKISTKSDLREKGFTSNSKVQPIVWGEATVGSMKPAVTSQEKRECIWTCYSLSPLSQNPGPKSMEWCPPAGWVFPQQWIR